jgi:hypothetical protein
MAPAAALARFLQAAGLAAMAYVGYLAVEARETARMAQLDPGGLAPPLAAALAAAALAALAGGLLSGELLPVDLGDAPAPTVLRPHSINYATFGHRGPLLGALERRRARRAGG